MKSRHFKKMRIKLLSDKKFIEYHITLLKIELKRLKKFEVFECEKALRGKLLAELNQKQHDREYNKAVARLKYLQKRIHNLTNRNCSR